MPTPSLVELIRAKRDGHALAPEDIAEMVRAYTAGEAPDYQMSAFLMAAFLRGLSEAETAALTDAMLHSGEILDLRAIPGVKVDKHSTGGVGDKVSLVLAPLVAACGAPVPMVSGRGLGHTGGTLDKLESIPGFRTDLSAARFAEVLGACGVAMIGQTAEIAPADRKLYALRDVTATVEFIPFIAASIMSKKLAEGIDALVLDVKCGGGAFMRTLGDARRLAEALCGVAARFGKPCVALVTNMNAPLGRAVGNWPEVAESLAMLRGAYAPGLTEVTLALAAEMLLLAGKASGPAQAWALAEDALRSGAALETLRRMVAAQHGDTAALEPGYRRPDQPEAIEITAGPEHAGRLEAIDAYGLGRLSVALGAGRARKEDPVDPTAGIELGRTVGEAVAPGDLLARIYTRRPSADLAQRFTSLLRISKRPPAPEPMLLGRLEGGRWTEGAACERYYSEPRSASIAPGSR